MNDPRIQDQLTQAAGCIERREFRAAEDLCHAVLWRHPEHSAALTLLGLVARETQRLELAIDCFQTVLAQSGGLDRIPLELGITLLQAGRPEQALVHLQFAAERTPNCHVTQFNLGNALRQLGQVEEAKACFQRAVEIEPQFAQAQWNLGLACLLTGDWERGWPAYDWREQAEEVRIDAYSGPRWRGESLADKTILVHAEQGIGDEILFASCYPELIRQARKTILVCEPRLAPLFTRSFPAAKIYSYQRRKDRSPAQLPETYDLQIPAGCLPRFLRSTAANFPQRKRFLLADPSQQRAWRNRLHELGTGLKVGISWQAGGQPAERRKRTTTLDQWRELFAVPGVQFVNLQYGDVESELSAARHDLGVTIHDWPDNDPLVDQDGFAAKIAALDLVISVGNATVHLAGALGAETWTLLPRVPGWRWMLSGEQSIWYPSLKLFRQTECADWMPVFAQVEQELRRFAAAHATESAKTCTPHANSIVPTSYIPSSPIPQSPAVAPAFDRLADVPETLAQARTALQTGNVRKAELLGQEILSHLPRHVPTLRLMAAIARQDRQFETAIRHLTRAVSVQAEEPQLLYELGGLLHAAGQREAATERYQLAIALQPDFAKPFNALGGLFLEQGRLEEAQSAFRRALELQPDYLAACYNLGRTLQKQQRFTEAADYFHCALRLDASCQPAAKALIEIETRIATNSPRSIAS